MMKHNKLLKLTEEILNKPISNIKVHLKVESLLKEDPI